MVTELELTLVRQYLQAWPSAPVIRTEDCYDLMQGMKEIINYVRDNQNDIDKLERLIQILDLRVTSQKLLEFFHVHENTVKQP